MTERDQPTLTFHDGRTMPALGFGTWQVPDGDAANLVATAIRVGYRLIDTAAIYRNERGVSEGVTRDDVFFTTKIWNDDQGYDATLAAWEASAKRTGRESVDLLLMHWPCPDKDLYVETWRAMLRLREEGKARSVGVSNFGEAHLRRLIEETGEVPVLNQVELHPSFQQRALRSVHEELGIVTQSWSPLGQGGAMDDPAITAIAEETGQAPAAVILRWHLQHGLSPIPKASSEARIAQNFTALNFSLSDAQMAAIDDLDREDGRIGPPPEGVN